MSDFAALLNQTTARTASAEGHETRPTKPEHRGTRERFGEDSPSGALEAAATTPDDAAPVTDAPAPAETAPGAEAEPAVASPAATVPATAVPVPIPTLPDTAADTAAAAAVPVAPTAAESAATTAATAAAFVASAASAAASTSALEAWQVATPAAATTAAATTAAATPGLAVPGAPLPGTTPTTPAPASSPPPATSPVPTDGTATAATSSPGGLHLPDALLGGQGSATGQDASGDPGGHPPDRPAVAAAALVPTPAAPPATAPAAPTAPVPGASATDTSATTATAAPAPAPAPGAAGTGTAPTSTAPPASAVAATPPPQLSRPGLAATVERVQDLVRIAATRAGARATLQLKPYELGTVDVRLRVTSDGLVASISAQDPAGLQALQSAGSELRRSLEDRGVVLHSLELQLSPGSSGAGGDAGAGRTGQENHSRSSSLGALTDDQTIDDDLTATAVTSLPAGVLVDVQA